MGAQSKTSARRVKARDRQSTALKLRASGATFAAIGEHLGVSAQAAHRLVKQAIDEIPAEALADLRAVELGRLDRLTAAVWREATGGTYKAIDTIIKLMERRAKLTGLDAPVLTDDVSGWTDEELLDYATTGKRPARRGGRVGVETAGTVQSDTATPVVNPVADIGPTAQP